MDRLHSLSPLSLLVILLHTNYSVAQTSSGLKPLAVLTDVHGSDLPPGALLKLGTARHGDTEFCYETHKAEIHSVAYSSDGKRAATVSGPEHLIFIWETASGAPIARIEISCKEKNDTCQWRHGATLLFTPDCKKLICDDKVYDAATGRLIAALPAAVLGQSTDGKLLGRAAAERHSSQDRLVIWEDTTGKETSSFVPFDMKPDDNHESRISSAALSPNGRYVAVSMAKPSIDEKQSDSIHLFEASNGKWLRSFRPDDETPFELVFSPDGELLASATTKEQLIQLWRISDGSEVHCPKRQADDLQRATHPATNGKLLAAADSDGSIVLWEIISGKEVHRLPGCNWSASSLRFAPDGRTLLAGFANGEALVWNLSPQIKTTDFSTVKLERLWEDLADEDAATAYRAAWALVAAPKKAIGLFKEHLKPLPLPDVHRLPRLLLDLDSEEFDAREAASQELKGLGCQAEESLLKTLESKPSLEVERRVQMLLNEIHDRPMLQSQMRQLRAIRTLEWIGTPAADVLATLARGPESLRTTREAEAALRRLHCAGAKCP
jgi:WD40 repeat protein